MVNNQLRSVSMDTFQMMVEQSPISTQIFDNDGRAIFVNRAWEDMWRVKSDSILYTYNILHDKQLQGKKLMFFIQEAFEGEKNELPITRYEFKKTLSHALKDSYRFIGGVIYPIMNGKSEVTHVVLQYYDVTDTYEAYQSEQAHIEQEKSDFLSMASHELKTPLTSMKMFLELLGRMLDATELEQAKYFVNRIHDQTNQLVELTNDLLDVSRIETGKLRLNIQEFPLDTLVHETVEAIVTSTRSHKLILKNSTPIQIYADRYRIFQVLINLLTNAIKYSPGGKDIIVALEKNHDTATVHVQDFGIGISKDHLGKIFDRLYQVNEPRAKTYPGLGLGLYISKEIITRHKGNIWVESTIGKGSTFSFALPLGTSAKN